MYRKLFFSGQIWLLNQLLYEFTGRNGAEYAHNEQVLTDERILDSGDFVDSIIMEADHRVKYQFGSNKIREKAAEFIDGELWDQNRENDKIDNIFSRFCWQKSEKFIRLNYGKNIKYIR